MSKKPRILRIACNNLGIGGIQTRIMVVTRLLANDIDNDIVVFTSEPAYFDDEFKKYGKIFNCPNYEGSNPIRKKLDYYTRYFKIKKNIYKIIKENGPYDVVHSHAFFETAPCIAAAKKAGVPIRIAHSHNTGLIPERKSLRYIIQEIYRKIYRKIIVKNGTHFIGCSQAAADYVFGEGVGRPIYNCVNCEKFNPALYESTPHTDLRLIHVGNFTPQKNQLFLLDVFKEILNKRNDVHLTLIGRKDGYFKLVEEKIKKDKLEDYITILPPDSNVPEALSQADFFIFPSSFEGFGNVMLEAQSMGLKCFASTEVTTEVNCGLTQYIPLKSGAKVWADIILDEALKGTEKHPADMSRFTEEAFASQFLEIYNGEV